MINLDEIDDKLTSIFETITASELQAILYRQGYDIEVVDLEAEARQRAEEEYHPIFRYPVEAWKGTMAVEMEQPAQWILSPETIWAQGSSMYDNECISIGKADAAREVFGFDLDVTLHLGGNASATKPFPIQPMQALKDIVYNTFMEKAPLVTILASPMSAPITDAANSSEVALAA